MKLYRESLLDGDQSKEPELIADHESVDHLKAIARSLVHADGCTDIMWLSGSDTNPPMDFPLELEVNGTHRFRIAQE